MSLKLSRIKNYFIFSKGERNGIIILITLMLLLILSPFFYSSFFHPTPSDNLNFYSKVDSFYSSTRLKPDESIKLKEDLIESEEIECPKNRNYFFFDPNNVSIEEMVLLGLSLKQANVVEKYRSKGGKFRTPDEFSKVYVIDSSLFRKLKPWIRINLTAINTLPRFNGDTTMKNGDRPIHFEINTADTIELVKLKGIGKVYARRIIAYRSLLGGYVNIKQLSEVYGIKPELINKIESSISIDSTKIKLININLATYEELKKHPYINDYQAKAIVYYRSKVGNIKNTTELLANKILPFDKFEAIKCYLTTH